MADIIIMLMLAISATSADPSSYYTTEEKGLGRLEPNELRYFYVPAGQCSGTLDRALTCRDGKLPLVIRVDMTDDVPFPIIAIGNKLDTVTVLREPDVTDQCRTRANLNVSLFCSRFYAGRSAEPVARVALPVKTII